MKNEDARIKQREIENKTIEKKTELDEFKPNFDAFNKFQNFQNFESLKTNVTGNEASNQHDIYAGFNFGQAKQSGKIIKNYFNLQKLNLRNKKSHKYCLLKLLSKI